jgi:hypothetical protein
MFLCKVIGFFLTCCWQRRVNQLVPDLKKRRLSLACGRCVTIDGSQSSTTAKMFDRELELNEISLLKPLLAMLNNSEFKSRWEIINFTTCHEQLLPLCVSLTKTID